MKIVRAIPENAAALTEIAFAAKRHWSYPESWIKAWADVLTVTPDFIRQHETFVAVVDCQACGFYALLGHEDHVSLEHFWVSPAAMGRGVGRRMFAHAIARAKLLRLGRLEIESDPNAEGFYQKMGARRVGSRIGRVDTVERELPVLIFEIENTNSVATKPS